MLSGIQLHVFSVVYAQMGTYGYMCAILQLQCLLRQEEVDTVSSLFGQELVEGKSLAQMVEAGWKPAQKEVERIADELLSTFSYLQQQQVSSEMHSWLTICGSVQHAVLPVSHACWLL